MAPMTIKAIVEAVLSQEGKMKEAMYTYKDNNFVNDSVASVTHVKEHLSRFRLDSRDPKFLKK